MRAISSGEYALGDSLTQSRKDAKTREEGLKAMPAIYVTPP